MAKLIRIGIECEPIEEKQSWGVAREVNNLLARIAARPELEKEFKFFLYFKSVIPDYDYLQNPIFVKKIIQPAMGSFSLYYYLFLPIKLLFERLDAVYFPNYMLPIIYRGKSLVSLTEDVFYEIKNNDLPFRYRLAYRIFSNWAAKHATKIMAFSESSKKAIGKLFKISPDRIFVNYHGVEISAKCLQSGHLDGSAFGGKNYALYLGQAFPRRHLRETLLAFEKISLKYPDMKFVAIGKDKYNPPIIKDLVEKINQRLGGIRIEYKTYVNDEELIELYGGAKFIAYISDREAFGLPPLEGLGYCTMPVVADVPVNREIYGENAFFVNDPVSVDSIASVMEKALNDKEKIEQIKNSVAGIVSKFNWLTHTDKFLSIMKEIVSL